MTEHVKEWWNGNERDLPDGSYTDSYGSVCYIKNGKRHREDGPAVEWDDGDEDWYRNGELHREDGPAVEWADGTKWWCINGKRHREDGPAIEYIDGTKEWWVNDQRFETKDDYEEALKIWKMNEAMK